MFAAAAVRLYQACCCPFRRRQAQFFCGNAALSDGHAAYTLPPESKVWEKRE
jgi:hypothetical protein